MVFVQLTRLKWFNVSKIFRCGLLTVSIKDGLRSSLIVDQGSRFLPKWNTEKKPTLPEDSGRVAGKFQNAAFIEQRSFVCAVLEAHQYEAPHACGVGGSGGRGSLVQNLLV